MPVTLPKMSWVSPDERKIQCLKVIHQTQVKQMNTVISILQNIHMKQSSIETELKQYNEKFEHLRIALLQAVSEETKSIG